MKAKGLALLLVACCAAAHAQTSWLTVSGDPSNAEVDTIQVDPVSVETQAGMKTMRVRVNRAEMRASWEGVPYRSYESTVLFDCARSRARYMSITYHMEPNWGGLPHRTVSYATGEPRMMEFRQVSPNPNQRIIHAACGGTGAR